MIIDKRVKVKWNGNNRKHYESKGYSFTKGGDEFEVDFYELPRSSHKRIKVECDFCKNVVEKRYSEILDSKELEFYGDLDCCKKCVSKKNKMVSKEKYGVDSPMKLKEVQEKAKKTNRLKYGENSPMCNQDIQKKSSETTMKNYGVDNISKSEYFKKKYKSTMLENYGVEHYSKTDKYKEDYKKTSMERFGETSPLKSQDVRKKLVKTNMERYGVPYVMMNENILKKAMETMYKNNTAPTSRQQDYIHSIIGGEKNFVVGRSFLDIGMPNKMIYLEYDGGGHSLSDLRTGEGETEKKDRRRFFSLLDKGWRMIKIKSKEDKLPSKNKIIEMVNFATIEIMSHGRKSVIFDIDNSTVRFDKKDYSYDFGEVKRLESNYKGGEEI